MHVIDLEDNEYPLQATTTNEYELNGNQNLSMKILPSKANKLFIEKLTEMWTVVDHDDVAHKIIYFKRQGEGDTQSIDIKAIPLFFDDMSSLRIYDRYDQHMTAQACFNIIFEDSGYNFILNGSFDAIDWEGFGEGDTRLTMLKNALNRYSAEFRIVGNTIYIENLIGRDTQFMYRYRLNASNIVLEHDASEFYTYAIGYGDYGDGEGSEDWQDANLIREYTSPLAEIPGIGIRHAPPIKNGNITTTETMDEQLKTLVDESLKISVSATLHDLRKQNYPLAQPQMGDRVFLIDERIGLNDEVRVVDMSIVRNWKGEVVDINLTFGTPGLVKRHQAELESARQAINDLINGRRKLPWSVYDARVQEATRAMQNVMTELTVPPNGGLMAVDKDDPNNVVIYNAAGLFVSEDGGATASQAIWGGGINASVITAGEMLADRIAGGILQSLNGNTFFNLNTGRLDMENANFVLGGGARIDFTSRGNRITYRYGDDITRSAGMGVGISLSDYPFAYLGTTGASELDTLSRWYSGLITSTTANIADGGTNSMSGYRFQFRNEAVSWTRGMTLDWYNNTINFINGDSNTYDMRYLSRISSRRLDIWNPASDSQYGFSFHTAWWNDDSVRPGFRGRNAGSVNYDLGYSNQRWNQIFLKNDPDISSDKRLKHDIKENVLGLEFIKEVETKQFKLNSNEDEEEQVGIIAQQILPLLEKYEANISMVSMGRDGYYGFKHNQLLAPIMKSIQEIADRLEVVENRTT